ncbi:flagellar export chaperone FliS [Pseudomonas sp. C27(2019)]|uniref:flagellar export chaperone FliS n=1 Tax=Pseudomonas sp. C27(2019) TaxID=2604941 RepID=UPI00124786D6|nr:flagellar export chaperone FliS [Pseudomonas sp. C27(2019)]QEY59170.1 flagellar export chaperone FliS [Pseudomonas sp. C27(2019)]
MNKPMQTYNSVAAGQDLTPYQAVELLLDGALECISKALIAQQENNAAQRGEAVGTTLTIIGLLQDSLDKTLGGELAENLDALYDYMTRRLAGVAVDKTPHSLEEVQGIVLQLREGWSQIDPASEPKEL